MIIRTAAANRPDEDILGDLDVLPPGVERDPAQVARRERTPAVLFREESLVAKLLRDLLTDEFSVIRIDSAERAPPRHRARRADHAGDGCRA